MDKDFELLWDELYGVKEDDKVDVNQIIGNAFREYRRKNGFTIRKLAELVDMDPSTLSNIENGHWNLTTKRLQTFVDRADCKLVFELLPKEQKEE